DGIDPDAPFDDDVWELYHVATDLTECDDLAATQPEKLAELRDIWWTEARRFQVLPLDNRPIAALLAPRRPRDSRARYVFWPGGASRSAGSVRVTGRLLVDGRLVGEAEIPHVTPVRYSITGGGITCGWEQGPAVGDDYDAPFPFTGTVRRVVVEVDGQPHRDANAEFEAIMSEQ